MKDQVSYELVQSNFDEVLSEHFTDQEQFLLFAKDQDFDLDTCLELCDQVKLLNEEMLDKNMEQRQELLQSNLEFDAHSMEEECAPRAHDAVENQSVSTDEKESYAWSWW